MTRKFDAEREILRILVEQRKETDEPWIQKTLRDLINKELKQPMEGPKRKKGKPYSTSQIHHAVSALSNTGQIAIGSLQAIGKRKLGKKETGKKRPGLHKKRPIILTPWGFLCWLSLFSTQEDVIRMMQDLDKLAENHKEVLPILFENWGYFKTQEMSGKILHRIRDYFIANLQEFCSLNSDFKSVPEDSSEQLEIDRFIDYVLLKPILQPSERPWEEIENWTDLVAKKEALTNFIDTRFKFYFRRPSQAKELLMKRKRLSKAIELSEKRPKKLKLLLKKLSAKINQFRETTELEPRFSDELNVFVGGGLLPLYSKGEVSEIKAKMILREGYQAWAGLSIVLMLEPTQFRILNKKYELREAEKTVKFSFPSLKSGENAALCYRSNFTFYSRASDSIINFGFDRSFEHLSSIILLSKERQQDGMQIVLHYSPLFLISTEEASDWALRTVFLPGKFINIPKAKIEALVEYSNCLDPERMFVVCWEKEDDSFLNFPYVSFKKLPSQIKILNGVGFDEQKLMPIIKDLKNPRNPTK
jgi:hypothetical protein